MIREEEKTDIWCKCGHLEEEHAFSRIYDWPTNRFLRNETRCHGRDAAYNKAAHETIKDEDLSKRLNNGDILLEDVIGYPVCTCSTFIPLEKEKE